MRDSESSLKYVAPVLRVTDLNRSLSYYRKELGFELEFNFKSIYASVIRDGCRVHLKCSPPAQRDQAAFEAAEHLDACFGVSGVQALAEACASSGAVFTVPLRSVPYGTEFYVKDPDGYILGFIQPDDAA